MSKAFLAVALNSTGLTVGVGVGVGTGVGVGVGSTGLKTGLGDGFGAAFAAMPLFHTSFVPLEQDLQETEAKYLLSVTSLYAASGKNKS